MRRIKILSIALTASALMLTACKGSDSNEDTGMNGPQDMGVVDLGPPDTGVAPDSGVPDTGPLPCIRDRGGAANRGCESGEVCNLITGECGPGRACTDDNECNTCSEFTDPEDCGHGFNLTTWCDSSHGNVCTRSKAPCEPCSGTDDNSCGRSHPQLSNITLACLDYGNSEFFCGRSANLGCPQGFESDQNSMCRREGGICDPEPVICPEGDPNQACTTDQICEGEVCPDTGGARCSTNDVPGALGICIGFCQQNSDCPPASPVCNQGNGICISGCTAGSCPGGEVCHSDGFCDPPCMDNAYCENDPRYGATTYCNLRTQVQPPRVFKNYRDENACAPQGCERAVDCSSAGLVCDSAVAPPECVPGCFTTEDDCLSGEVCKSGPQGNYDREGCRELPSKEDETEIGVCCNPGCTSRVLQCDINDFCCAEEGSPYEDETTCLTQTSTSPNQAEPGECFEMGAPGPWCTQCMGMPGECSSGWTPGFNTDPNINGGQPFQEQEWCVGIAMGLGICNVSCDPNALDNGCPRGWQCGPFIPGCFQDADCNGLTCVGADPPNMVQGRCQCGENGAPTAACPQAYSLLGDAVTNPRCVELFGDGNLYCIAGYNCSPPPLQVNMMTGATNYPTACGF